MSEESSEGDEWPTADSRRPEALPGSDTVQRPTQAHLPAVYCRVCGRSGWAALPPEADPQKLETGPLKIWQAAVGRDKRRLRYFISATPAEARDALAALTGSAPKAAGAWTRSPCSCWTGAGHLPHARRRGRGGVDTEDFQAAVERPATIVTTTDDALREALEGEDFGRWKVFLHPTQAKLVGRDYSGPARVGGGPGTGKTIVALHRVKHLVGRLPAGRNKPVLLTTYNKNLAADLRSRLLALGGETLLSRVEISHVDQLALRTVREAEPGNRKRIVDEAQAVREWRSLLDELGEDGWDPEFLHDEWTQVILGQAVTSRTEYFRARRAGRGRTVSRAERAEIWQLAERFTQRLDRLGVQTWDQIAERAAQLEVARARRIQAIDQQRDEAGGLDNVHVADGSGGWLRYRYRHIVVDEAQDLRPAHWKMLRAMTAPDRNDLFLVGDTHQRIYKNQVTLGSLGINIRGRSSKLSLSYRTTRQVLPSPLPLQRVSRGSDGPERPFVAVRIDVRLHGPHEGRCRSARRFVHTAARARRNRNGARGGVGEGVGAAPGTLIPPTYTLSICERIETR